MNLTPEDALLEVIFLCDFGAGLDLASTIVTEDDFILEFNRRMWKAMLAVHRRGEPLDCSCLSAQLMADGMKEPDAVNLLMRVMDGAPLKGFTEMYAKRVKEAGQRHRTAKVIELANLRIADGEDENWVKAELAEDLLHLEAARTEVREHTMAEIAPQAIQALADRLNGDESKLGLRTGIAQLDFMTTGINADEVWIVGGMPGRGKTALGLQIANELAGTGKPVYLISLEMSANAIFRRLLKMKFGGVAENPGKRWDEVTAYAEDLYTLPLYVNDSPSLSAQEIVSLARIAIQHHGIRLVVVDYLQLIRMEKGMERREAVGDSMNALRALAKETHVPVLVLSQLRRPQSLNDRPTMIDLKESGDIEAHSHVVLLMYMPVAADGGFSGSEEIIIGKQREGPIGIVPVYFEGARGLFHARDTRG